MKIQNIRWMAWSIVIGLVVLMACGSALAAAPQPFALTAPTNNEAQASIQPKLLWEESVGATGYDVYFDSSQPPSLYAEGLADNQCSVSGLVADTTYYWYVVATNNDNSVQYPATGSWSFHTWAYDTIVGVSTTMTSAADLSILVYSQAVLTLEGLHQPDNIYLIDNSTLTHPTTTTNDVYSLVLTNVQYLYIEEGSTVDVSGRGYRGGYTVGNTTNGASSYRAGGSYGGFGGGYYENSFVCDTYGDYRDPLYPGSGGSQYAASGGGLFRIQAGRVTVHGSICADGDHTSRAGGSGGGIYIDTDRLEGRGEITATVFSSPGVWMGIGGGGRVAVYYEAVGDDFDLTNDISCMGGDCYLANDYVEEGSAGTIYLRKKTEAYGLLLINSEGVGNRNYTPTTVYDDDVLLMNKNRIIFDADNRIHNLEVRDQAVITHLRATTSTVYRVKLNVDNQLIIRTNSSIHVSGRGYLSGHWKGNTTIDASVGYAGGSYGGLGGTSRPSVWVNPIYGTNVFPDHCGSGAGYANSGGGLIQVSARDFILDGVLLAEGGLDSSVGGGSGGGIYISTCNFGGDGSVSADGRGSMSSGYHGGGGGGRIAIYATNYFGAVITNRIHADGGTVLEGGLDNQDGEDGTVLVADYFSPLFIHDVLPEYTSGTVSRITFEFGTPLDTTSISVADFAVTNEQGQAVSITSGELEGEYTYHLNFSPAITNVGVYSISLDTDNVCTKWGGNLPGLTQYPMTIVNTAPPAPVLTNFSTTADTTNVVAEQNVKLEGCCGEDLVIFINGADYTLQTSTFWDCYYMMNEGLNILDIVARDRAGQESDSITAEFLVDTTGPVVTNMFPLPDSSVYTPPAQIDIYYVEEISGLTLQPSDYSVIYSNLAVPGTWSDFESGTLRFTPNGTLQHGSYLVEVTLTDDLGNESSLFSEPFSIDQEPPATPVLNDVTTNTTANPLSITGWREENTAVYLGESCIVAIGASTNWAYDLSFTNGNNPFSFKAVDAASNESAVTNISIYYTNLAPGAVSPSVTEEGSGTEISLTWTSYDEVTNGNDILQYDIYQAASAFSDVSSAVCITQRPAGQKSVTIRGLTRGQTRHYAVVAVDTQTNYLENVTSVSATPQDVEPPSDLTNVWFICESNDLTLCWADNTHLPADLQGFRIWVSDVWKADYPATSNQYAQGGFDPASNFAFKISCYDNDNNFSDGVTVTGYTLLPNPINVSVEPFDGYASISWNSISATSCLSHYVLYADTTDYTNVAHLTGLVEATDNHASVAGLENDVPYYFSVTAVNKSQGENQNVETESETTLKDTQGPVVSNLFWNGEDLPEDYTWPGTLGIQVADPAGIARVQCSITNQPLVQTSLSSNDTYGFAWDVSLTAADGIHECRFVAWDTLGNSNVLTTNLTVNLAPPPAPVITRPAAGTVVNRSVLSIQGTGVLYATSVTITNSASTNRAYLEPDSAGAFRGIFELTNGSNDLCACASNRAGFSTASLPVYVELNTDTPIPPGNVHATALSEGEISIRWTAPIGTDIKGYKVYRSSETFTDTSTATLISGSTPVNVFYYTDIPISTGTSYYAVTTVNNADTESAISELTEAVPDDTAPSITNVVIVSDGLSEERDGGAVAYAEGSLTITIELNEPLLATPFFTVMTAAGQPAPIDMQMISNTVYQGTFTIESNTVAGTATFVFSGKDRVGNWGSIIDATDSIIIDNEGPVATALNIQPPSPVLNDASATVTAIISFAANDLPETTPVLQYKLDSTHTNPTAITLQPLTDASWWGTVTLPVDAGTPAENMIFLYQGVDSLGNTGQTINGSASVQVYQGDLEPLASPTGLAGEARPEGAAYLSWNAVEGAAGYILYRGTASDNLTILSNNLTELECDDQIGDDAYWYAVASLREANGQGATSAVSSAVQVQGDATAPGVPADLAMTLSGQGILLTWTAATGTPDYYRAYRHSTSNGLVSPLYLIADNISGEAVLDANPVNGPAWYTITAVDAAGNVSEAATPVYTNIALLPVSAVSILVDEEDFPVIQWSHPHPAAVENFILTACDADSNVLAEETFDSSVTNWTDVTADGSERIYRIYVVDGTSTSAVRTIRVPGVELTMLSTNALRRGVMNRISYQVDHNGTLAASNMYVSCALVSNQCQSADFSVEPAGAVLTNLVVGGYESLPAVVVLTNDLCLSDSPGEQVILRSRCTRDVIDDLMSVEIRNEPFVRGAYGTARFVLHNTSEEPIEIVMATNTASGFKASPEVRMKLEDPDGMLYAIGDVLQWQSPVTSRWNGVAVAYIPPGESFESADISLMVPTNVGESAVVRLEIDHLHYHVGSDDHVVINGLETTREILLTETSYETSVADVTPPVSSGYSNITISGVASNRATGAVEAGVPIKVVVSLNGFERTYTVYSDTNGAWSLEYEPAAQEFGVFKVWAVHPDIVDKPEQATFTVQGVEVASTEYLVTVPRNYSQEIPVKIRACDITLTNVSLSYAAEDQPGGVFPEHVYIVTNEPLGVVAAGVSTTINFTVWADNDADSSADIVLRLVSDESPAEGWAVISVDCSFPSAYPVLNYEPDQIETGVSVSNSVTEQITLINNGYHDLHDIELSIVDEYGNPGPDWIKLPAGAISVLHGDGRQTIPVTFAPTNGVASGTYEYYLRARAADGTVCEVLLAVGVDDQGTGGLCVRVLDQYQYGSLTNGPDSGLKDARVWLQKDTGSGFITNGITAANGIVEFDELPVGSYRLRVTADAHVSYNGRVWIKPGITATPQIVLENSLVTVEWQVVPTTIKDEYEIILEATFETTVPAPVVYIDPPMIVLPEMAVGDVYSGEFLLMNKGLIEAVEVELTTSTDDSSKLEILATVPDTLAAGEVVHLPYRITKVTDDSDAESSGSDSGGTASACIRHSYYCPDGTLYRVGGKVCFGYADGWYYPYPVCDGCGSHPTSFGAAGGGTAHTFKRKPVVMGGGVTCLGIGGKCPPWADIFSKVILTDGQYQSDMLDDMIIPVLHDRAELRRKYYNDEWHFNVDWSKLNFEYELMLSGSQRLETVTLHEFPYKRANVRGTVFVAEHSSLSRITVLEEGGYRWEDGYGQWRTYDEDGYIIDEGVRNISTLIYQRDASNRVCGVCDHATNQVLWIEYDDSGRLISVRDLQDTNQARIVTYQYSPAGLLTNVVDVMGTDTSYTYTEADRIATKTYPDGRCITVTYYDNGVVASVLDQEGNGKYFTDYSYDSVANEIYVAIRDSEGNITERWVDPTANDNVRRSLNGEVVWDRDDPDTSPLAPIITKNEHGQVLRIEYPDGSVATREYNGPWHALSREVSVMGVITDYQYDEHGYLTNLIKAVGTDVEQQTAYTYDSLGNQISRRVSGPILIEDSWSYDAKGNILFHTNAVGSVTSYEYDYLGRFVQTIDALAQQETYTYDAASRLTVITNAAGYVTENYYDLAGRLIRTVLPGGLTNSYTYNTLSQRIGSEDADGRIAQYEYDLNGKLLKKTDPDGPITVYAYDELGRITHEQRGTQVATYKYDSKGRVAEIETPNGVTQNLYDSYTGRKIKEVLPTGITNCFKYDNRGRLMMLISSGEIIRTNQWEYDAEGHLIKKIDPLGRNRTYQYDVLGRKIAEIDPAGYTNRIDYRTDLMQVDLNDKAGNVLRLVYNALGQVVCRAYADDTSTEYKIDAIGQITQRVDAVGTVTRWNYNPLGFATNVSFWSSTNVATPGRSVALTYDEQGRIIGYRDGLTSASYTRNRQNNTYEVVVDYGVFSMNYTESYNEKGLQVGYTDPLGRYQSYTYDENGRLSTITIPDLGDMSCTYNVNGLLASYELPGGAKREYTYNSEQQIDLLSASDAAGQNLMLRDYDFDAAGRIIGETTEYGERSYGYDVRDQIISADYPQMDDETFSYDGPGNRIMHTQGTNIYTYGVNELNQYTVITTGVHRLEQAYDAAGRAVMIQRHLNEGIVTNYLEYNLMGRLSVLRDGESNVVARYDYDPFGNRIRKIIYTNAVAETNWYIYGREGLIAEMNNTGAIQRVYGYIPRSAWMNNPAYISAVEEVTNTYLYYNDHLGTPQKITSGNGIPKWGGRQQVFGEIHVDSSTQISSSLRFSSQYYDGESELHYNTHRYYDNKDARYEKKDPIIEPDMDYNGYRYHSSELVRRTPKDPVVDNVGTWPKDPMAFHIILEESSYGFVQNNPISAQDFLGLCRLWYKCTLADEQGKCDKTCTYSCIEYKRVQPAYGRHTPCWKVHEPFTFAKQLIVEGWKVWGICCKKGKCPDDFSGVGTHGGGGIDCSKHGCKKGCKRIAQLSKKGCKFSPNPAICKAAVASAKILCIESCEVCSNP